MSLKSVVLVEDHPADAELALAAFEEAGLQNPVVVLRDGAQALDYLRAHLDGSRDHDPALVLLDIDLPKVTGYELLDIANDDERLRGLPIVMVTGTPREEELLRYYETGARGYVAKPITIDKLLKASAIAGAFCRLEGGGKAAFSIHRFADADA